MLIKPCHDMFCPFAQACTDAPVKANQALPLVVLLRSYVEFSELRAIANQLTPKVRVPHGGDVFQASLRPYTSPCVLHHGVSSSVSAFVWGCLRKRIVLLLGCIPGPAHVPVCLCMRMHLHVLLCWLGGHAHSTHTTSKHAFTDMRVDPNTQTNLEDTKGLLKSLDTDGDHRVSAEVGQHIQALHHAVRHLHHACNQCVCVCVCVCV